MADHAGRIPHHQCKIGHVLGHNAPGAYQRIATDLMAANNCRIGANACPFSHDRLSVLRFSLDKATRIDHICKHTGGAQEDVVLADHSRVN